MTRVRLVRVPFLLAFPPRGKYAAQVLLPRTVFALTGVELTDAMLRHEAGHIIQIERMGVVRYWLAWVSSWLRMGYERNALEVEAEELARTPEARRLADLLRKADTGG